MVENPPKKRYSIFVWSSAFHVLGASPVLMRRAGITLVVGVKAGFTKEFGRIDSQ